MRRDVLSQMEEPVNVRDDPLNRVFPKVPTSSHWQESQSREKSLEKWLIQPYIDLLAFEEMSIWIEVHIHFLFPGGEVHVPEVWPIGVSSEARRALRSPA